MSEKSQETLEAAQTAIKDPALLKTVVDAWRGHPAVHARIPRRSSAKSRKSMRICSFPSKVSLSMR